MLKFGPTFQIPFGVTKPRGACETLIPCVLAQLASSVSTWPSQLSSPAGDPQTKSWTLRVSGSVRPDPQCFGLQSWWCWGVGEGML